MRPTCQLGGLQPLRDAVVRAKHVNANKAVNAFFWLTFAALITMWG